MDFGSALQAIKAGHRVARAGWNGKGMWLVLIQSWAGIDNSHHKEPPEGYQGNLPFIAMFTADKHLVPWLCSQTDALASDWEVV